MEEQIYTLGSWRVRQGREEELIELWRGDLASYFLSLPHPPPAGTATLVQSIDDPQQFYSFGPWDSIDDIREMRADPRTKDVIGRLAEVCEEAKPGTYRVIARA